MIFQWKNLFNIQLLLHCKWKHSEPNLVHASTTHRGHSNNTKSATRGTMVWKISTWQTNYLPSFIEGFFASNYQHHIYSCGTKSIHGGRWWWERNWLWVDSRSYFAIGDKFPEPCHVDEVLPSIHGLHPLRVIPSFLI